METKGNKQKRQKKGLLNPRFMEEILSKMECQLICYTQELEIKTYGVRQTWAHVKTL